MMTLPTMRNGKTFVDESWWTGKAEHEPPEVPTTLDEAEKLVWARCWAYGEAKGMTTREWHLMWPIVYAAVDAFRTAVTTKPPPMQEDEPTDEGEETA